MITKTNQRTEILTALEQSNVWKQDRWGHFQHNNGTFQYRLKVQDLTMRFEKQITLSDGKREWLNIASDYYRNIRLGERDGKPVLGIGNRALPR